MSGMDRKIEVLFKNHQWMVQNDNGTLFLVEILQDYPDDLEGGYWIEAKSLGMKEPSGHTWLMQVCEKTWVDYDAFEEAARAAIRIANPVMHYDFDREMASTRAICEPRRRKWEERQKSGVTPTMAEMIDEILEELEER